MAACCVVVSPSWAFAALVPSPPCAFDTYLPAAWLLSAALRVGCATVRPGHACLTGMGKEDRPKGCANCQVIEMGAGDVMARFLTGLGELIPPLVLFFALCLWPLPAPALSPRSAPHLCLTRRVPHPFVDEEQGVLACKGMEMSGPCLGLPQPPSKGPWLGAVLLFSPLGLRLTAADSLRRGSQGRKERLRVMILIKPADLSERTDPAHQSRVRSTVQRNLFTGDLGSETCVPPGDSREDTTWDAAAQTVATSSARGRFHGACSG